MVVQNLKPEGYQSQEAKLFLLKQRADRVSDFISSMRKAKGKVYIQIMNEVTGIEALVTLQSFLLQVSLYCRKYSDMRLSKILEVYRAHEALYHYYKEQDFKPMLDYLREIKNLFELVKE